MECPSCGLQDILLHRFTECKDTRTILIWTQKHIASYLRINARDVKDTWITLPDFEIRAIQKHNATVWMIGHMLGYMYDNPTLTMQDFLDFLKRARWKTYNQRHKFPSCGKYLDVIDYWLDVWLLQLRKRCEHKDQREWRGHMLTIRNTLTSGVTTVTTR